MNRITLRNGHNVTLDGVPLTPTRSLRLRNHSPTGFSWGYGGSGPAQLALAILLEHTHDEKAALRHYMQFKWDHVGKWPFNQDHDIEIDLDAWLAQQQAEEIFENGTSL